VPGSTTGCSTANLGEANRLPLERDTHVSGGPVLCHEVIKSLSERSAYSGTPPSMKPCRELVQHLSDGDDGIPVVVADLAVE
jgi:hypothetical protein